MLWQKSRRAEEFLKRDNSKKRAPDRARARCIVIRGACPHMAMRVHPARTESQDAGDLSL